MRLFLVSAIALAFCVPAFAGVSDYEFDLTDITGAESATGTSTVSLTIGGDAVSGWQFAVCHDTTLMTLQDPGVTSLELGDPAFEGIIEEGDDGYWNVGVVISFGTDTLAVGGDAYECSYTLGVPGTGTLDICDEGLNNDGVSVAVGLDSVAADGNSADVTILSPFTYRLINGTGNYDETTGVGTGSVDVEIQEDPVGDVTDINAFTVAVSNDSSKCTPSDATASGDLDDPEYFSASVTSDSCVVAAISSLTDFDAALQFDTAMVALTIEYDTNPTFEDFDGTDDPVVTDHDFEDTDEVQNEVAGIGTDDVVMTIVPNLESGTIEWTAGTSPGFKRGDCDGNNVVFPILDALYVLEYGFTNGPTPPCLAAADGDGNGVVFPILDALYILEYGFTNGPEPPDPGPFDCGPDTNDPGPGCETPPAC